MGPALHLPRPTQESPKFAAFAPHEFPELEETDLLHLHAGIGLDAPEEIGTPPRREAMAPGGIPQEADLVAHDLIITTVSAGLQSPCKAPLGRLDSLFDLARAGEAAFPGFLNVRIQALTDSCMSDARQKAEDVYYSALDLMAEGHLEKAVAAYRESINTDPTFTEAMHGLARALQDLERFDEAIEVAKKIAVIDPDDVLAHTSLSVLYQKKGMIAEAEAEGAKARVLGWKQQLKKGS